MTLRLGLHALGLLGGLALGCTVPEPPLPAPGERRMAEHPAVGCWELIAVRGRSAYLPGTVRVRLDTTLVRPDAKRALMHVQLDTGTIIRMIGDRPIFIAQWAPFRKGDRIYLFWGDGLSGLDMRLRVNEDRMQGPSAQTTDFGIDHDGPEIVGRRVPCVQT